MDKITLLAASCWNNVYFTVTFPTEALAVDYVTTRGDHLAFFPFDDETPVDLDRYPALAEALFPSCEHGLSQQLCYGEGHYPAYGVNTMDPTWR